MREPCRLSTPLHDAAANGDDDVLHLLVRYGARLDVTDSAGSLAWERAEANSHRSAAAYLREEATRDVVITLLG
nr:isoform 3 of cyclin-dependent kinase inhibitor 2a [Quercus suber]